MKIWLGLLSVLLSFSASASDSYDKNLDVPSDQINEHKNTRVVWGGNDSLEAARTILYNSDSSVSNRTGNRYIYKDKGGQILLTNVNPSGSFDKFTKKIKETSYKDSVYRDIEKDREREWERQLNKKPAAKIGMSHKQVLSDTNWGKPKDVRTTIDASGTLEQWMYSSTHSLYFKGGKLIKIEK